MAQLSRITTFVSLIERSRLGEFSWPFAHELRRISQLLLNEKDLKGDRLEPIIHVVAEGQGYRIFYERQVPLPSIQRRFLVVAFPRSLKHHVLLHTLFGHEVGHTAVFTTEAGAVLSGEVKNSLLGSSPLADLTRLNNWLQSKHAPQFVKDELDEFEKVTGRQFALLEAHRESWQIELICDLFGMMLF
ncbi:MAG: hypothetical protein F4X83_10275, partial [Chloroflexi bacterium]|nr:hypothetical protein [Chloroflexota bacterium]